MFNVSTVGINNSISSIYVVIFAFLILGEKLSTIQFISVILAFSAVSLILIGSEATENEVFSEPTTFGYACLIFIPICVGAGDIAMRKMRKLHEIVVSFYLNFALTILSAFFIAFFPPNVHAAEGEFENFAFFKDLNGMTWFLIFLMGTINVFAQMAKF
jgi:drug/metabolite transporter (DMT)-like permease